MIGFCFDEIPNNIDINGCRQRTISADKLASLHTFHTIISSGGNYENMLDKDMRSFFESMKMEIANNGLILEQHLDEFM
jgi:hypothetical protein